jgi:hypothetical protein
MTEAFPFYMYQTFQKSTFTYGKEARLVARPNLVTTDPGIVSLRTGHISILVI